MTATLGQFLILVSLLVSTTGALIGFYSGRVRTAESVQWARRFAYAYAARPRLDAIAPFWVAALALGILATPRGYELDGLD